MHPGNHTGNFENLTGEPGYNDIGVVTGSQRCQSVRPFDASLYKNIMVKTIPANDLTLERGAEAFKSGRVIVHNRNFRFILAEGLCQFGTLPAATNNHDFHTVPPGFETLFIVRSRLRTCALRSSSASNNDGVHANKNSQFCSGNAAVPIASWKNGT
jgi:hypothetical protein